MRVQRIDLADCGSPERLVMEILKQEPSLSAPVPIEDLCFQLDIGKISDEDVDSFVGSLITDQARSNGIVVVKSGISNERRRFTIAHELGHFLIPAHIPDLADRFICQPSDLRTRSPKDPRAKREAEANRFASLILMPPPLLRKAFNKQSDARLENLFELARQFEVSKEAMARAYADHHHEAVTVAILQHGKVERLYRHRNFPRLAIEKGHVVPRGSLINRVSRLPLRMPSGVEECNAGFWLDIEWGRRAPKLWEQVCKLANGWAFVMLTTASEDDDYDPEEDRTSKQRLQDRRDDRR